MKFLAIPLILMITACAATGPLYREVNVESDKSVIYIYRRPGLAMSARQSYFELDERPHAVLKNKGYTHIVVDPGVYHIRQNWNYWMLDNSKLQDFLEIEVTAHAARATYVELKADISSEGIETIVRWRLQQVNEDYAKKHIKDCRYQELIRN